MVISTFSRPPTPVTFLDDGTVTFDLFRNFVHRVTTQGMPQRTVFQLARLADHRAFAMVFDPICAPNISTIRLAACKSNGFRSSMSD